MFKSDILSKLLFLLFLAFASALAQPEKTYVPNAVGPYLGQKPPGLTPALFAPGIISTDANEFACTISPDGKEIFFTRRDTAQNRNIIMVARQDEKGWLTPVTTPKIGDFEGMEPYVTPDGKKLFFQTWRQFSDAEKPSMDIWMSEKTEAGWGEPVHLDHPFNPNKAMYISMAKNGTIYTTDISGGMGSGKIVYTLPKENKYQDFIPLPEIINATGREIYPCIAPDESFLLFVRANQDMTTAIFVSFKKPDGTWDNPQKIDLGTDHAVMPQLSPDGKYLFFMVSPGRLKGDIYWVDAAVIPAAKQKK